MSWWGALVGGTLGFFVGGPIGAVLGGALGGTLSGGAGRGGHAAAAPDRRERVQASFFGATFSVMGCVAKADGRVTAEEIRLANEVMGRLGLNAAQRRMARDLFNAGKAPDFPLDDVVAQLRRECRGGNHLLGMFLEIQFEAALAHGGMHTEERRLLWRIAQGLGISEADFAAIEQMLGVGGQVPATSGPSLEEAYATLGITPDATEAEAKRAYRRMMSRHHPDKLAAKGLPDEMMRAATERTQQIKAAWERVKASHAA